MAAPMVAVAAANSPIGKKLIGAAVALILVLVAALGGGVVMVAAAITQYTNPEATGVGDDYPFKLGTINTLSPLGYDYGECVDFIAWRINEAAGTPSAPYAFTWGVLTPGGGDAYEWKPAWQAHDWPVSATPSAGWIAWWDAGTVGSLGHVAWVTAVDPVAGTITIEEYNWGTTHRFNTRTIPFGAGIPGAPTGYLGAPMGGWKMAAGGFNPLYG